METVYILYTKIVQDVYNLFMQNVHTNCIPHLDKRLYTFCIQN